ESASPLLPRPETPARFRGRLAGLLSGRVRGPQPPLDPARPAHPCRGAARSRTRGGPPGTCQLRPLGLVDRPPPLLCARALATRALLDSCPSRVRVARGACV